MADSYAVAKEMYPILKDYEYKIVNTPNENSPYRLEHFPPGEEGSATMPRPKDISIDEYGLQIFKDVRPEDIAGDIISHHLVNEDEYLSKEYQKFKSSVPSETMMSRYEYHKNNLGEERDFDSWSERTGYPELFRGYVFNQFDEETINNLYSSEQKIILNDIKNYITKKGFAEGGDINQQTEKAFGLKERIQSFLNYDLNQDAPGNTPIFDRPEPIENPTAGQAITQAINTVPSMVKSGVEGVAELGKKVYEDPNILVDAAIAAKNIVYNPKDVPFLAAIRSR